MERPIPDMASMVNESLTFVRREAQEMEIGEVERRLISLVMEFGRAALQEFVAVKGTGYAGKEVVDAQGNRCPYVRDRSCTYRSIFGTIPIRRAYYHAAGSSGIFPLDGNLNLPERGYSYLVQEFSSRLAITTSYKNAQEILRSFFPLKMPIRSLESIVGDVCDEVDRFYEEKAPPKVSSEAVVTVATVDKKGVIIRKPPTDEAGSEAAVPNPDKPGKKKMATVISAYTTRRHLRTVNDIVRETTGQDNAGSKSRPENKYVCGSLTDSPEKTVTRLTKAVSQRLPQDNELVCLLDGERSLWTLTYT